MKPIKPTIAGYFKYIWNFLFSINIKRLEMKTECTDNLQLTIAKQGQIDNLEQQLLYFSPRLLGIVKVENNCSMLNQLCVSSFHW